MGFKQVIVIRKDLRMRKGKACSQAAHASMKVILDLMTKEYFQDSVLLSIKIKKQTPLFNWITGLFTKIVVSVDSERELKEIFQIASQKQIPCCIIEDVGLTEFHGAVTLTCCAIGPAEDELIDKITGHLQLL